MAIIRSFRELKVYQGAGPKPVARIAPLNFNAPAISVSLSATKWGRGSGRGGAQGSWGKLSDRVHGEARLTAAEAAALPLIRRSSQSSILHLHLPFEILDH
jgi:hypothetical protein